MLRSLLAGLVLLFPLSAPTAECVVLLHGLGRTSLSLVWAENRLRRAGFRPVNIGYPSRKRGIPELARHVADRLPRTTESAS